MADLLFVAIVVAFFALAAGFVRVLERMIDRDGLGTADHEGVGDRLAAPAPTAGATR